MCAMEMVKVWALREASRELHDGKDKLPWVAARVVKNDGTRPSAQKVWAQHSPIPRRILAERMHTCVSHGSGNASGIPRFNLTLLI